MFAGMVAEMMENVPELHTFVWKTNEAGSGICWSDWQYTGPNGPTHCKNHSMGERVASLMNSFKDGADAAGQDISIYLTGSMFSDEEKDDIFAHLPEDWRMFVEYKPYEPNFYSTVIQDWGTSHLLANQVGPKAYSLVDLGHHLPNTNIEQIVATLLWTGKLGGFHFNDSKYGDDDLTVGSIKPYQLFLIFVELVASLQGKAPTLAHGSAARPEIAWMIDARHNVKDPLEDLMQSLEAIWLAYAQALVLDRGALAEARRNRDVVQAQEVFQDA